MKKLLTLIAISTLGLSGCETFEAISTLNSFGSSPIVQASSNNGATKASILAVGVKPVNEQPTKNFKGSCVDFPLRQEGTSADYYVAFDEKDRVVAYGFTTCSAINSELRTSKR